jgi:hypothetical protein
MMCAKITNIWNFLQDSHYHIIDLKVGNKIRRNICKKSTKEIEPNIKAIDDCISMYTLLGIYIGPSNSQFYKHLQT